MIIKKIDEKSSEDDVKELEDKPIQKEDIELIHVDKNYDSDDETVDFFFNDMSKLMENKGIRVKDSNTYTLFDDAIIEEEEKEE